MWDYVKGHVGYKGRLEWGISLGELIKRPSVIKKLENFLCKSLDNYFTCKYWMIIHEPLYRISMFPSHMNYCHFCCWKEFHMLKIFQALKAVIKLILWYGTVSFFSPANVFFSSVKRMVLLLCLLTATWGRKKALGLYIKLLILAQWVIQILQL